VMPSTTRAKLSCCSGNVNAVVIFDVTILLLARRLKKATRTRITCASELRK
jgi:hypothetical protein